jgi:hypothetical protein
MLVCLILAAIVAYELLGDKISLHCLVLLLLSMAFIFYISPDNHQVAKIFFGAVFRLF